MNTSNFIGYFELSPNNIIKNRKISVDKNIVDGKDVYVINNIITPEELNFLLDEVKKNNAVPVGIDGIAKNYKENTKIHSYRSTIFDEELADVIFARIFKLLKPLRNSYSNNDFFIPYAVNPAFRFIRYAEEGYLVPHYDYPYKEGDDNLSLMSLVIYLTTNEDGQTQFVEEYRENDNSDWDRAANENEIRLSIKPEQASALLFQHNMLHQSETSSQEKIIIRTDIMYKRVI